MRSMSGGRVVVSVVVLGGLVAQNYACSPPVAPVVAPTATASASAPVVEETPARWRGINAVPTGASVLLRAWVKGGELAIDRGGVRWLAGDNGTTAHAKTPLDEPMVDIGWREGAGLIMVSQSGNIWLSAEPLGEAKKIGTLPSGVSAESVTVYQGVLNAEGASGPVFSTDLKTWGAPGFFADRAPIRVVVGEKGEGLGLFAPQAVARTQDGGKTWSALSDDGAPVQWIEKRVDIKESLALVPENPRDHFSRVWSPGKTTFDLRGEEETEEGAFLRSRYTRRRSSVNRPDAAGSWRQPRTRAEKHSALYTEQAAIDGDKIYYEPILTESNGKGAVVMDAGVLGEAMAPYTFALSRPLGTGSAIIKACGGAIALRTENMIIVKKKDGTVLEVEAPTKYPQIAFNGPDKLVIVGEKQPAEKNMGLWSLSLADGAVSKVDGAVDSSESVVLTERCQEAGAWMRVQNKRIYVYKENKWSFVRDLNSNEGANQAVGVDAQGSLIMRATDGQQWIKTTPEGVVTESKSPGDVRVDSFAGAIASGHHLIWGEDGLFQTDDSGQTWKAIASPPYVIKGQKPTVICGTTRCELDDTLVRFGWEPDSVSGVKTEEPKVVEEPDTRPFRIDCKKSTPAGWKAPAVDDVTEVVTGSGQALWSGIGVNETKAGGKEYYALYGQTDGSVSTEKLGVAAPSRDSFSFSRLALGAVFAEGDSNQAERTGLSFRLVWSAGPKTPIRTGRITTRLSGPDLMSGFPSSDGFAIINRATSEIVWFRGDGKTQQRPWPGVLGGRWTELNGAMVAEDGAGNWYALAPSLEPIVGQGGFSATLVMIDKDGNRKVRSFLWAGAVTEERGIGLVKQGANIGLALVELVPDGSVELRVRPIESDLRLGAAKSVPGTKGQKGGVLSLKPCKNNQTGDLLWTLINDTLAVVVDGEEHSGAVLRKVRYSQDSACVERTVVSAATGETLSVKGALPWEREAELVIDGDGGGAGVLYKESRSSPGKVTPVVCNVAAK